MAGTRDYDDARGGFWGFGCQDLRDDELREEEWADVVRYDLIFEAVDGEFE
jgi:hypothetical protein